MSVAKKILLDMDGVLVDFNKGFYLRWKNKFPHLPTIKPEDQHLRYISSCYTELLGEDGERKALDIIWEDGFFLGLPEIPFAVKAANKLLSLGFDVRICAHYCDEFDFTSVKHKWVLLHFGEKWRDRIIFTKDKTLIYADFLVDDNSYPTGKQQPTWRNIVYDQPYNRNTNDLRILSWEKEINNNFPSFC